MSVEPVTYYTIVCDECGADYFAGSEYSAWSDPSSASEMFSDDGGDWSTYEFSDGVRHRCPDHNPFCEHCGADAGELCGERDYMCPTCFLAVSA